MEVAPYWLFSHPQLTVGDYYNPYTSKDFLEGLGQCFLQNLSISVANAPVSNEFNSPANATGQGIGIGVRTLLFQGQMSKDLATDIGKIDDLAVAYSNDVVNGTDGTDLLNQMAQATSMAQADNKLPVGFFMELAAAEVINVDGNDFSQAKSSSFGIWITPSYGFDADKTMSLQAVGRFIDDQLDSRDYYDFGGSFAKSWGSTQASAEFIGRFAANGGSNTYRIACSIYGPMQNDLYWSASFGKNFDPINSGTGDLITLLGINLGLGPKPTVNKL